MDMTGISSLGMGPQTLRIIPELRTNSLLVSGPYDQVQEVENWLNVLDSDQLSASLRERQPQMISVKYADINQVADIVKEVYKDAMESPQSQRGGGNPFAAMMMGGGGRGGREDSSRGGDAGIKLTVGVDTNTSHLIISANAELFQEIETMVTKLDEQARLARRSVQVVSLQNTNAALIQSALGSILPKVKVSTTGSGSRPSSNSTNNTSGDSSRSSESSGAPSPDVMRQMFEQRMRERIQGGPGSDSGRSPFGGSSRGSDRGGPSGGSNPFDRGGRGR
jgi:hypothetical protein